MSYTPPSATANATWVGAAPYGGATGHISPTWDTDVYLSSQGFATALFGLPALVKRQFAAPAGIDSMRFGAHPAVTHPIDYVPSTGTLNASWLGADPYAPPTSVITATWAVDVFVTVLGMHDEQVPAPTLIQQQFIAPAGIALLEFGPHYVLLEGQYAPPIWTINASWFNALSYTPPSSTLDVRWLLPSPDTFASTIGWDNSEFGDATIYLGQQAIQNASLADQFTSGLALVAVTRTMTNVGGLSTLVMGSAWVSNWIRTLAPAGMSTSVWANPYVAYATQTINLVSRGIDPGPFGTSRFDLGNREVFPQWFVTMVFGTPQFGYHREALPAGFQTDAWGLPTVRDNKQFIDQAGNITGVVGAHDIFQLDRVMRPVGIWEADEYKIGPVTVRNSRKYIVVTYIETQWEHPNGVVSADLHIYNRNRVLDLIGNGIAPQFQQVPISHVVELGADGVAVPGFEASVFGQQLVAYRNRNVAPPGWDSLIDGEYRVVFNAAFAIQPFGWNSMSMGTPESVVNTRRYFPPWQVGETLEFGVPFIALAIRTLAPAGIEPGRFGVDDLNVWYRVRTIAPTGWQYTPFGLVAFDIRFNIVRPNQIAPDNRWGAETRVRNLTPQLYPYWDEALFTRFGATAVFNQDNYYSVQGMSTLAFGLHYVADRRQSVIVPPMSTLIFQHLTQVRNEIPDPPATQHAYPGGIILNTYLEPARVGMAVLTANSLYPEGWVETGFGNDMRVYINGIFPLGITPPWDDGSEMGTPTVNPTQYVTFDGSDQEPTDDPEAPTQDDLLMFAAGKPRMSPHTIYAPIGASQQYKLNNPPGDEEPMDRVFFTSGQSSMPAWGRPFVSNRIRTIYPTSTDQQGRPVEGFLEFGDATASTNPQYIAVNGFASFKYGIARVNNGQEAIVVGFAPEEFGVPELSFIPEQDRVLPVVGFRADVYGNAWVSNFIREIPPAGIPPGPFGTAHPQFPPPPAEPAGLNTFVAGTHLIAYRIRNVTAIGWDNFECDYTPGQFALRMRVYGTGGVRPVGIDVSVFGVPAIGEGFRELRVQGIEVGPLAVPVPDVRARNIAALAGFGWDSSEFGDIQEWEPGTIKPFGSDLAEFGLAELARTVDAGMGDTLAIGGHDVLAGIGVPGFDAAEYGETILMGFGCGRQARAIPGWSDSAMGLPGVVHAPPSGQHAVPGWVSMIFSDGSSPEGDVDKVLFNVRGRNGVEPPGFTWFGGNIEPIFGQFGEANIDRSSFGTAGEK